MPKNISNNQKGQALVPLLIFVMVAISITVAATIIIGTNSLSGTNVSQGLATKQMAEAGAEKAMLQLLRDPTYSGGVFDLDTGHVTVVVTGNPNVKIDSTAVNGEFTKKIEVNATYSNNVLTQVSWKEVN